MLVTSCEKMIDVDQPDIIEQDQAFSDKNSIRLSIIGIYGLMSDLVETMFLAGEVRADLVIANKSADPDIKEFSNNSFSGSNPYISPKPFYNIINNTNDFINQFEGLVEEDRMSSTDFIKYKSELVAIRVWCQYQVAKIYGYCDYYTEIQISDSSNFGYYSYEDTSFIRTLINDLTFSDTNNFTATNEPVIWQTIRFSDFYVNELMGELYLDLGDYENALAKLQEVTAYGDKDNRIIGRFKITTAFDNPSDWFYELFYLDWETSDLTNHAVFMIAFDNKYNQTNELWNWTLSLNYQVSPASWFANQFYAHAIADEDNIDYRVLSLLNNSSEIQSRYVIRKYQEDDRPFIMTRTARMSLLKAYCYNLIEDKKNACKELNYVRKRAGYGIEVDYKEIPEDETGTEMLENFIIDELAYETAFEGQRWFDLMRVAIRRNDPSYLASRVAQKYSEDSREEIRTKLLDKTNWYIPVFE